MLSRFLLLTTCFGFALSAALAQSQPSPASFLRHPTSGEPHLGRLPAPASPAPTVAPLPTVQAAALIATPVPASASLSSAAERPMGLDLTGNRAYPVYDPNQNMVSEAYRKYTRTALPPEPVATQLLRGLLGK